MRDALSNVLMAGDVIQFSGTFTGANAITLLTPLPTVSVDLIFDGGNTPYAFVFTSGVQTYQNFQYSPGISGSSITSVSGSTLEFSNTTSFPLFFNTPVVISGAGATIESSGIYCVHFKVREISNSALQFFAC